MEEYAKAWHQKGVWKNEGSSVCLDPRGEDGGSAAKWGSGRRDQTAFGLACVLSHVQLCNPVDCSVPGSSLCPWKFPRQEYWSGLPFPSPGDLPDPGSNPHLFCLLHWQADSLPLNHLGSPTYSLEEPLKSLYSVLRVHHSAASLTGNHYISSHCPKWAIFTSLVICTSLSQ